MAGTTHAADPCRIFLTGEPGSGKTTVVKRTADLLAGRGFKVGGMTSKEIRERGNRTGFSIEDSMTHEEGVLATVRSSGGPHVGRYVVNLQDLESVGAGAIQRATETADVILVDELGPMELNSQRFIESVEAALNSQKHVLGTIHKRSNHALVTKVKSNPKYTILEVTFGNRDELPAQILRRVTGGK